MNGKAMLDVLEAEIPESLLCLLYTSDAADEL